MQTYLESIQEIAEEGGTYTLWLKWRRDINAGEWNHFCFQLSVKDRRFAVVHNGYTQAQSAQNI